MSKNTPKYQVSEILDQELEQVLPAGNIQLWAAVEKKLQAADSPPVLSGQMVDAQSRSKRIRFAFAAGILTILLGVALASPPGQALAQTVLEFFRRAESTSFPVEPIEGNVAEQSTSPTVEPPGPYLEIDEVIEAVGFKPGLLSAVPDGFQYLGARLYADTVALEYQADGGGGSLIISQSQSGYDQSDWDQVPADAVETVQVGEMAAEYVEGAFVVFPGEDEAAWNPDVPLARLRWKEAGIWIQITKSGNTETIEYLDREALIEVAERIKFD